MKMVGFEMITEPHPLSIVLPVIFIICLIEKFIPIVPSSILFAAVGIGASNINELALAIASASVGSVGGSVVWYLFGRWTTEQTVRKMIKHYGRWIFLRVNFYDKMSLMYQRRPFIITVFGQIIPTVRTFQGLPAGVLRLRFWPFIAATAAGTMCWIIPLAGAGFTLQMKGWTSSEVYAGLSLAPLLVGGIALLALVVIAWHVLRKVTYASSPPTVILIAGGDGELC